MVLVVSDLWLVISVALLGGSLLAQKGISGAGCCRNDDRLLHRDTGKAGPHGCIQRSELQGESDGNALQAGGISNEGTAARCARELRETGEFDSCYYVAAYYYLPLGQLENFSTSCRRACCRNAPIPKRGTAP